MIATWPAQYSSSTTIRPSSRSPPASSPDLGIGDVVTAEDAATAIRAANATRPAAALVDIGLPDRNGIDLAHELARLPWQPRVVLTSTDRDAINAITSDGRTPLPFVPKDDLATAPLRRMLTSE